MTDESTNVHHNLIMRHSEWQWPQLMVPQDTQPVFSTRAQDSTMTLTAACPHPAGSPAQGALGSGPIPNRAPSYRSAAVHWERKHGQACPYAQPAGEGCPYTRPREHDAHMSTFVRNRFGRHQVASSAALSASGTRCCGDTFGSGFGRFSDTTTAWEHTATATRCTTDRSIGSIGVGADSVNSERYERAASADEEKSAMTKQKLKIIKGRKRGAAVHIGQRKVPTLLELHKRVIEAALREMSRPREGPFANIGERLGGERDGFTYCDGSIRLPKAATASGVGVVFSMARCASAECTAVDVNSKPRGGVNRSKSRKMRRVQTAGPLDRTPTTRLPKFDNKSERGDAGPLSSKITSGPRLVEERRHHSDLPTKRSTTDGTFVDKDWSRETSRGRLQVDSDQGRQSAASAPPPIPSRLVYSDHGDSPRRVSGGPQFSTERPGTADNVSQQQHTSFRHNSAEEKVPSSASLVVTSKRNRRSSPSVIEAVSVGVHIPGETTAREQKRTPVERPIVNRTATSSNLSSATAVDDGNVLGVDSADRTSDAESEATPRTPKEGTRPATNGKADLLTASARQAEPSAQAADQGIGGILLQHSQSRQGVVSSGAEKADSLEPADKPDAIRTPVLADGELATDQSAGQMSGHSMPRTLSSNTSSRHWSVAGELSSHDHIHASNKSLVSAVPHDRVGNRNSLAATEDLFAGDNSSTEGEATLVAGAATVPRIGDGTEMTLPDIGMPRVPSNSEVPDASKAPTNRANPIQDASEVPALCGCTGNSKASGSGYSSPISWLESGTPPSELSVENDRNGNALLEQSTCSPDADADTKRLSAAVASESIAAGLLQVAATAIIAQEESLAPAEGSPTQRHPWDFSAKNVLEYLASEVAEECIRKASRGLIAEIGLPPKREVPVMNPTKNAPLYTINGSTTTPSLGDPFSNSYLTAKEKEEAKETTTVSTAPPTPADGQTPGSDEVRSFFPADEPQSSSRPALPPALLNDLLSLGASSLKPLEEQPKEWAVEREQEEARAREELAGDELRARARELSALEALIHAESLDSYRPELFSPQGPVYGEGKHSVVYRMGWKPPTAAGDEVYDRGVADVAAAGEQVHFEAFDATTTLVETEGDVSRTLARRLTASVVEAATARAMSICHNYTALEGARPRAEVEEATATGTGLLEQRVYPRTVDTPAEMPITENECLPSDVPAAFPPVVAAKEFRYMRPEAPAAILRDARREAYMHLRVRDCERIVALHGIWLLPRVTLLLEAMNAGSLHGFIRRGGLHDCGLEGRADKQLIEEGNPNPTGEPTRRRNDTRRATARLLVQAAEGLAALHQAGIVHRDVKSHNLMMMSARHEGDRKGFDCWGWDAKIGDLGSAALMPEENGVMLTEEVGTSGWVAPEVFGGAGYGTPADIFSMGVLIWEAFTGGALDNPLSGLAGESCRRVLEEGVRPSIPLAMPRVVRELIERCWSFEPEKRPTAEEVAKELTAYSEVGSR